MLRTIGVYEALGTTFEVRASEPLADIVSATFADLHPGNGGRGGVVQLTARRHRAGDWSVWEDRRIRIDGTDEASALHVLLICLNELVARRAAADHLVVHASSVDVDGQVVAFAGGGGAGKSRLALWLTMRGAGFVAEDVCAVDAGGVALPFHRPAGLRAESAAELGVDVPEGPYGWVLPLRASDHGPLSPGGPLGLLVVARRGSGEPVARRIAPPEALATLSPMTIAAPGAEATMFRRLERLVRNVPVVELTYADVRQVGDLVRAELEANRT